MGTPKRTTREKTEAKAALPAGFPRWERIPVRVGFDPGNAVFRALEARAYELYERRGRARGRELEDWLRAEGELLRPVHPEVRIERQAVIVFYALPRWQARDLEIFIESGRLIVTGMRVTTRGAARLFSVVSLPENCNLAKASAAIRKGALGIAISRVR